MEHIEDASRRRGHDYVDLALLTDGLRAEREQGITIDVAYRGFVTPRRRFQLADAPGHVQYTRNMVTGASTADVAVVLVDARQGVIEQTRRHSYIVSMLELPHVVYAVNKMDLVDYAEERFDEIARELASVCVQLDIRDATVIPMSALHGGNVVERSEEIVLVRRTDAARASRGRRARRRCEPRRSTLPGAVGDPADDRRAPRLPRLRRTSGGRRVARGRPGARAAVGPRVARRGRRHRWRAGRGGRAGTVGDDPARGRRRRVARRPARRSCASADGRRASCSRVSAGCPSVRSRRARALLVQADDPHRHRTRSTRSSRWSTSPRSRNAPSPGRLELNDLAVVAPPARRAARRRSLPAQPRDRRLHPHRRGDERDRRRRHGGRCVVRRCRRLIRTTTLW